jgi:hypothetical protein
MKISNNKTGKESPPIDKRTKAFRKYKKNLEDASKGLGDTIEKHITKPLGIKKAVDTVFDAMGKDCGCEERKQKLNKIFDSRKPECFTEEEFELVQMAVETKKRTFTPDEQKQFVAIYNRIFNHKIECMSCSFANTVWQNLVKVYNQYK